MRPPKINTTKNYDLFRFQTGDNRQLNLSKHKPLLDSMEEYGFLPCYPIICTRDAKGNLSIKDGQHRFAIARQLGLSVCWVEDASGFDVADVNSAQVSWVALDYVQRFASQGKEHYKTLLAFKEEHNIPITIAASLLAQNATFSNISEAFYAGDFVVKDVTWARQVANLYTGIKELSTKVRGANFLSACTAVSHVPGFSPKRLLECAKKCRQKLVPYAQRDAYLTMLEEIYNYGQKNLVALKLEAIKAMRARNPRHKGESND